MLASNASKKPIYAGGALSSGEIKSLLKASYEPDKLNSENWVLDTEISDGGNNNVFYNTKTNEAAMTVAGTNSISDWSNNAVYGIGGRKAYKKTSRYKSAEEVHDLAVKKYGADNLILLGHSQGGLAVSLLGGNDKEILTYNKATALGVQNKKNANQTDIRTDKDVVSYLNREVNNATETINTKFINPIKTHSINNFKKSKKKLYGK
jgi:hypothetical protein